MDEKYIEYKQAVLEYRDSGLEKSIGNKGADHAAIVSSAIFTGAKDYVKIYSGNLNSDVADSLDFISGILSLIENDLEVTVILDEFDSNNLSSSLQILYNEKKKNNKISIKLLRKGIAKRLIDNSVIKGHFMIADAHMIRKETDAKEYKADAWFNTNTEFYDNVFDFMLTLSTEIK